MQEAESLKVPETYRSELRVEAWPPLLPVLGPVVGAGLVLALLGLLLGRLTGQRRPWLTWVGISLVVGAGAAVLLV